MAKSFVQLVTHSCLKSVKPCQDISDKDLFAAESIQALGSNPILCFTADAIVYGSRFFLVEVDTICLGKGRQCFMSLSDKLIKHSYVSILVLPENGVIRRGHIKDNLNNFYNKLQRIVGTSTLRGPC